MYSFKNDYSEGCHARILETLTKSNLEQNNGYGEDTYSLQAKTFIREKLGNAQAEIHFISGGTQTNLIVTAAILKPHESVIAAQTAHIHVHEAGSIEATGHKINVVQSDNGKLTASDIQKVLEEHTNIPHMVKPKMVYISNSTEVGTVYSKSELEQLYNYCRENHLYLFMDGARLGSALCAEESDMSLSDVAKLTDLFYIGGTKNGALLGEALVINAKELQGEWGYHLKQRGALLAKGRVLGIQFYELFKDNLYFDLACHANKMALKMAKGIADKGYTFLTPPSSNQIFPIFPNELIQKLSAQYAFYAWVKIDNSYTAVRLITSWNTPESVVDDFLRNM